MISPPRSRRRRLETLILVAVVIVGLAAGLAVAGVALFLLLTL